jgi:3-oxoacyl-ACP reductase-like protein
MDVNFNPPAPWDPAKPLKAKIGWRAQGGLSAKLFVGLSVLGVPTYQADDVLQAVLRLRRAQVQQWLREGVVAGEEGGYVEHGGSVVPQLGYWEKVTTVGGEKHPTEQSVSVEIINTPKVSAEAFTAAIEQVAQQLAVDLHQMAVIVQILDTGIVREMFQVDTENA